MILPVTGEADDMGKSEEAKLRKLLHPDTELEFVAIEKGFQGGGDELRAKGIRIESLALIDEMKDGVIKFR